MHPIINKLKTLKIEMSNRNESEDTIRVYLKEHFQNHILNAIYKDQKFKDLIFYGGTCLRKLYELNRMSEDLDFETLAKIDLEELAMSLMKYFYDLEFDKVSYSIQQSEHVSRITMKFPILHEIGLSPIESENLHVKVEINNKITGNYPAEITPLIIDSMSMILKHYDLSTLMAGKIVACLDRIYKKGNTGIIVKGRDYYDLVWYMQKKIQPNKATLIDANSEYSINHVFTLLDEKIKKISSRDLLTDLEPLFSDKEFIRTWCQNFREFYWKFRDYYR